MALEISETGIRLTVGEPAAATPPAENGEVPPSAADRPPSRIEQIVNACVRRVLATLKRLQAR